MEDNNRILIVDDNPDIHDDFSLALDSTSSDADPEFQSLEQDLLGTVDNPDKSLSGTPNQYELFHAYQGEESVDLVEKSYQDGKPIALIFMDVRLPPGINGIEAVKQIWEKHPHTEVVICTAYSDISWDEIPKRLGNNEHLLFLKKPYDLIEARQLASSLTRKWNLSERARMYTEKIEELIQQRTVKLKNEIQRRKENEKALILAKEISEKANQEAQSAYKVKSEFLANISHEVRTPLNGILGFTDILLEDNPSEHQKKNLEIIQKCSDVLLSLINGILDLSKIEAGEFSLESKPINVPDVVMEAVNIVRSSLEKKPIHMNIQIAEQIKQNVIGDNLRLKQILMNLLDNAIKFTSEGEIKISITVINEDEHTLNMRFSIKDTGIGIKPGKAQNLFKVFIQQDSSTTRKYGGTGLGLSICKKIIELMGGKIHINEKSQKGAEFVFNIPFMKKAEKECFDLSFLKDD